MHFVFKNALLSCLLTGIVLFFTSASMLVAADTPAVDASYNKKYYTTDMSDFDPSNPVVPEGDTIKIAVMSAFSGPSAINGQLHYLPVQWVAHAVNKNGGIMVDGKRKLIQVLKGDTASKSDQTKKVAERMALLEKVDFFWGTNGSHLMKIINSVARRHKIISMNASANSDDLHDATNFTRYAFMTTWTTGQIGRGMAYYFGKIRKKERKFYILCQDYSFGRLLGDSFKQGLKKYYPDAEIVGEDYHKLFLTDFAPYLEKVRASGAEIIYTGDWIPDGSNMLKQARKMGVNIPVANLYLDEPITLNQIGIDGTRDLIQITQHGIGTNLKGENSYFTKDPALMTFMKNWQGLWASKWSPPYNIMLYKYPLGAIGSWLDQTFWLISVIERAGSTDPEKIIEVWEGDRYQLSTGKTVTMRACDHKSIHEFTVLEYVPPAEQKISYTIPPYRWWDNACGPGASYGIPADKIMPLIDPKLKRCSQVNAGQ